MNVNGRPMRTIWVAEDSTPDYPVVEIIDQTRLPHELIIVRLTTLEAAASAIRDMQVRGAPLIGAAAAYGVALAMVRDPSDAGLDNATKVLAATRPTAVNLAWALGEMRRALAALQPPQRLDVAMRQATAIADDDVAICR